MKFFENALQSGSFRKCRFPLSSGRMKTELFENVDVTASIYHLSEHELGSFSVIEVQMSNIVIEYRISLSNSQFRMSQHFRVDGDHFENGPCVNVDLSLYGKKMRFQIDLDTCGRDLRRPIEPFFSHTQAIFFHWCK